MDVSPRFQLHCPLCGEPGLSGSHSICKNCGSSYAVEGRILILEHEPSKDYGREGADVQFAVLDQHFWFSTRRAAIVKAVRNTMATDNNPRFMEMGCSNGYVLAALESVGWNVLGVDMHLHALQRAETTTKGDFVCALMENVNLSQRIDAVGLFDVIEHIEDDVGVLQHAKRQLKSGGFLVVTVPGLSCLWSEFDKLLGHKRRYSIGTLDQMFKDIGMETLLTRYVFSYAVPLLWLQRRLLSRKAGPQERDWRPFYRPPHPVVNAILGTCGRVENAIAEKGWNPPFGTSILALARKP